MMLDLEPQLTSHLRRHARKVHRLACGFGRQRDADDILQTLYARWWRRMTDEPGWSPPETNVELFVCVRRAVMDVVAKEQRDRSRLDRQDTPTAFVSSPEESLYAFERLSWILDRMPAALADVLKATLSAGRADDAAVAREMGLAYTTFTARLFKARRAAEDLATCYELLSLADANLMAELRYGGKTRLQIANDYGMSLEELASRSSRAIELLDKKRKVAS